MAGEDALMADSLWDRELMAVEEELIATSLWRIAGTRDVAREV